MHYTGITVTGQGTPFLPHAVSFDTAGTRATLTTSAFDGPLQVGQEYRIVCANPPANFKAKYVNVDGLTYHFDNVHQLAATAGAESTTPAEPDAVADDDEAEANEGVLSLGTCYGGRDCQGNVQGNNVSKADCFKNLQGKSWKANDAPRCWEN